VLAPMEHSDVTGSTALHCLHADHATDP
jgi:hypothetical protein